MPSSTIISIISYLCAIVGLGATMAYATTFYLTPYNEIYFSGQSGYDDTDLPYTLAIVECVVTGSVFIIGALAFPGDRHPSRNVVLVAAAMFAAGAVLQGTFGVIRGVHLGFIGDDVSRTCSDVGLSGCPTTRFEALPGRNRDIMFTSPFGGQCSFWFWGPGMKTRYDGFDTKGSNQNSNSCGEWGNTASICDKAIEEHMNWMKASSYGWRDDTTDITSLLKDTTSAVTIRKVHNMELLMKLQQTTTGNLTRADETPFSAAVKVAGAIPEEWRYTSQPSIAYCWYWGCSDTCQSHRYFVNHLWLVFSGVLTLVHLLNFILTLRVIPSQKKSLKEAVGVEVPELEGGYQRPALPTVGRRRRMQNPSGLLF